MYCVDDSCSNYRELLESSSLFILCNVLLIDALPVEVSYYVSLSISVPLYIARVFKDHIL